MRKVVASFCAGASLVLICACSGAAGAPSTLRGGPDEGLPKSSTDAPGNSDEQPGASSQDPPAGNGDSFCLSCTGNYSCTGNPDTFGSGGAVSVTLDEVQDGGCELSSDGGAFVIIACGGQVVEAEPDGTRIFLGDWSGNDDAFSVTFKKNGALVTRSCSLTNAAPPQSAIGIGTGVDGG